MIAREHSTQWLAYYFQKRQRINTRINQYNSYEYLFFVRLSTGTGKWFRNKLRPVVFIWHDRDSNPCVSESSVQQTDRINTLRPRRNGRHFTDDIFKCIFLNENVSISIKISLKLVLKGPIDNIPSLVQIMAWRRPGDKPLSEPMMVNLPTHICVTRLRWVKSSEHCYNIVVFFKMFP